MRISDWSSDVCSSDLAIGLLVWPDGCALSGYLALQRLEKLDQRHAIGVAEAASDILMASVMIPADVGLELETGVALAANADFHRIEFTAADHEGLGSRLFAESDLSLSWQPKVVETGHRAVVQVGRSSEEHTSELPSQM